MEQSPLQQRTDTLYDEFGKDLHRLSGEDQVDDILSIIGADAGANNSGSLTVAGDALGGVSDPSLNMNSAGMVQTTARSGSGLTVTVNPGEDIQKKLDTINTAGGGTLYLSAGTFTLSSNIIIYSNISLIGAGKDITIIDFNNSGKAIKSNGTSSSPNNNIVLRGFTVKNGSTVNIGQIHFVYTNNFVVDNVKSSNTAVFDNIYFEDCQNFLVSNCSSNSSVGSGFTVRRNTLASGTNVGGVFQNCVADSNTVSGFYMNGPDGIIFSMCIAKNTSPSSFGGFFCAGKNTLIGCSADSCYIGFYLASNGTSLVGCIASNVTTGGIGFATPSGSSNYRLVGCYAFGTSLGYSFDMDLNSSGIAIVGCGFEDVGTVPAFPSAMNDSIWQSSANTQMTSKYKREVLLMKNTSGGSLSQGSVVVFKSAAGGDEVTTTTTAGDNKVFGMVTTFGGIANNAYGYILVEGFTTKLKANGTAAISIGDYLSCYTSAGIAQKASAGQMVFAIALEAYSTADSNGVLDALLISPRLI